MTDPALDPIEPLLECWERDFNVPSLLVANLRACYKQAGYTCRMAVMSTPRVSQKHFFDGAGLGAGHDYTWRHVLNGHKSGFEWPLAEPETMPGDKPVPSKRGGKRKNSCEELKVRMHSNTRGIDANVIMKFFDESEYRVLAPYCGGTITEQKIIRRATKDVRHATPIPEPRPHRAAHRLQPRSTPHPAPGCSPPSNSVRLVRSLNPFPPAQVELFAGDLYSPSTELTPVSDWLEKLYGPLPQHAWAKNRTWFSYLTCTIRRARPNPSLFGVHGTLSGAATGERLAPTAVDIEHAEADIANAMRLQPTIDAAFERRTPSPAVAAPEAAAPEAAAYYLPPLTTDGGLPPLTTYHHLPLTTAYH